jgi:hypothetical protein
MRYTQGQVRDLLDLSVDGFRTWRELIPALAVHKGHGPTFTPGDVVVLAIIGELVKDFGVRVGLMADRFDRLFAECRGRSWVSLETCIVMFSRDAIHVTDVSVPQAPSADAATAIVIPCAPIVARLRIALVASEVEQQQGFLQFPPTAVGAR